MENILICIEEDCKYNQLIDQVKDTKKHWGHKVLSISEIQELLKNSEYRQQKAISRGEVIQQIQDYIQSLLNDVKSSIIQFGHELETMVQNMYDPSENVRQLTNELMKQKPDLNLLKNLPQCWSRILNPDEESLQVSRTKDESLDKIRRIGVGIKQLLQQFQFLNKILRLNQPDEVYQPTIVQPIIAQVNIKPQIIKSEEKSELHHNFTISMKSQWDVKSQISALCYSHDGSILASGDYNDGIIKLWNQSTGKLLGELKGHSSKSWIHELQFLNDSKTLVSCSEDSTIRFWDVDNQIQQCALMGHQGQVYGFSISPDERHLVSAGRDQKIRVWNISEKREISQLMGHRNQVQGVQFSPDGEILLSCGGDKSIIIWNFNTNQQIGALLGHSSGVWRVRFSSDGKRVVSSSYDQTLRVWDLERRITVAELRGHTGAIRQGFFLPNDQIVASSSNDGSIRFWDARTSQQVGETIRAHANNTFSFCCHAGLQILATASPDDTNLKQWDIGTKTDNFRDQNAAMKGQIK